MNLDLNAILLSVGAVLGTWIFSNAKLREGVTDRFISGLGVDSYDISNHNVKETVKSIKLEAKANDFENKLKEELYIFYVELILNTMIEIIDDILINYKKLSFDQLKKYIKNSVYDKLSNMDLSLKDTIKMPKDLQDKFNKFKNYLTMQHTYAIENALQSSNKKLLLIQVFDAIETNTRWFLFYTTEMFDNFNGHFDSLNRKDIFKK